MPGRKYNAGSYKYGYNGKEEDKEGLGGGGSTYDYGMRIYNAQIAKFLSTDPLTRSYPWFTPYQFAANDPLRNIDIDGLEGGSAVEYMFNAIGQQLQSWWESVTSSSTVPSDAPNKTAPKINKPQSTTELEKQTSTEVKEDTKVQPTENKATEIINTGKVEFASKHSSPAAGYSNDDDANADNNMQDAANNKAGKTSPYSDVGSTEVALNETMLEGMKKLSDKYSFSVSEVTGGDHGTGSRHYVGIAFDINKINGNQVNATNKDYKQFMKDAKTYGATEVIGPPSNGHGTHVHLGWPRSVLNKKKDSAPAYKWEPTAGNSSTGTPSAVQTYQTQ